MSKVNEKFDKVFIDLWRPHYLLSLSRTTYTAILLDAKTQKLWVLYLQSKDEFIDAFTSTWLPVVENRYSKSMKTFCIDREGEFISIKLKDFCDKKDIVIKYVTP